MDDVTSAELRQIRSQLERVQHDLERLEGLAEGIFRCLSKRGRDNWMEWWHSPDSTEYRRMKRGTPVMRIAPNGTLYARLWDADLFTLEEIAARPRREVAAAKGVGRTSMKRIDAALAAHGLSWAEAA
ncbi:MAG: hypothetical protein AABM66_08895 [Actinomycetota bacterium]